MGESRAILSLATLLSFRMLGLFMIYPVFAVYAKSFQHVTPTLIGITLGIYGLTQGLLQLPLSALSDRIGRKPVITGGLVAFALGSVLSAITHNIYLLVLGRALQGSGAIGSTIMATAADLTSLKHRTKAMAVLGMTIGLSFALAMVLGPLINAWFHLSGIFWLTAIFAILGIFIQYFFIPTIPKHHHLGSNESLFHSVKHLLCRSEINYFNLSIFLLHALFTASFVVVPLFLINLGIFPTSQWKIYFPILICAFIASIPLLILAEKRKYIKLTILSSIFFISLSELEFYYFSQFKMGLLCALALFFIGFTLLEALLPSLISKSAPTHQKGCAMGIFSTFQFLGIFAGGTTAGILQAHYNPLYIFYFAFATCIIWFILIMQMKTPIISTEN